MGLTDATLPIMVTRRQHGSTPKCCGLTARREGACDERRYAADEARRGQMSSGCGPGRDVFIARRLGQPLEHGGHLQFQWP